MKNKVVRSVLYAVVLAVFPMNGVCQSSVKECPAGTSTITDNKNEKHYACQRQKEYYQCNDGTQWKTGDYKNRTSCPSVDKDKNKVGGPLGGE